MTTRTALPLAGPGGLADRLSLSVSAHAGGIDERREIPAALIAELRDAGAFGLLTPLEQGGQEAPLPTVLQVYEEFGRLDASVAWVIWNGNFGFLGALLGAAGRARIWPAGRPAPVFANGLSEGVAIPVAGGYSVRGEWRMVSGVNAADWLVVVAVVQADDAPRTTAAGLPDVRLFAIPRKHVTVEDTWYVSGLRGTGSHDLRLADIVVPEELTARLNVPPALDRPLYRGFIPALVLPGCTAIALGVASAAIDAVNRVADTDKEPGGDSLVDCPRLPGVIGESEADLRAARLSLYAAAAALQAANEAATPATAQQRAELRGAMSHAARVSRRVLVAMYELTGSAALYRGNPLERQFRDGMAALQHANHSADAFAAAGRVRLGLNPRMLHF